MNIPDSPLTEIGTILGAQKFIPVYQREFVWDSTLRDNFIDNIIEAFENNTGYFIGSMVFQDGDEDQRYTIVDGQQRITTIVIVLISILAIVRARKLSEMEKSLFQKYRLMVCDAVTDEEGNITVESKLRHRDSKLDAYYDRLAKDDQDYEDYDFDEQYTSKLEQNLRAAREGLQQRLEEQFAEKETKEIVRFCKFIAEKLHCIHYLAKDVSTALTIYARLNSSGKALSNFEILKGMSFRAAEGVAADWDKLHEQWEKAEQLLQTKVQYGGEMRARLPIEDDKLLSYKLYLDLPHIGKAINKKQEQKNSDSGDDAINLPWVSKEQLPKVLLGDTILSMLAKDARGFVAKINEFSSEIIKLRRAKAGTQKIEEYLKDIAFLAAGQSQWLLVGIPLQRYFPEEEDAFKTLRNMVIVFSYALTGSGSASGIYRSLSYQLAIDEDGNKPNKEKLEQAISQMNAEIRAKWPKFENVVRDLDYGVVSHRKVLKRTLELVEIELHAMTTLGAVTHLLDLYNNKPKKSGLRKVELDHLQPTALSKLSEEKQGKLGNLALLEKMINGSQLDAAYESEDKQNALKQSIFLATKALTQKKEEYEKSGKGKLIPQYIKRREKMTDETVDQRTEELLAFLKSRLCHELLP